MTCDTLDFMWVSTLLEILAVERFINRRRLEIHVSTLLEILVDDAEGPDALGRPRGSFNPS